MSRSCPRLKAAVPYDLCIKTPARGGPFLLGFAGSMIPDHGDTRILRRAGAAERPYIERDWCAEAIASPIGARCRGGASF